MIGFEGFSLKSRPIIAKKNTASVTEYDQRKKEIAVFGPYIAEYTLFDLVASEEKRRQLPTIDRSLKKSIDPREFHNMGSLKGRVLRRGFASYRK